MEKFKLEKFVEECENELVDFMNKNEKDAPHDKFTLVSHLIYYIDEKTESTRFSFDVYKELKLDKDKLHASILSKVNDENNGIDAFNMFIFSELYNIVSEKLDLQLIKDDSEIIDEMKTDIIGECEKINNFSFRHFNDKIMEAIEEKAQKPKQVFFADSMKIIESKSNENVFQIYKSLNLTAVNLEEFILGLEGRVFNDSTNFVELFVFKEYGIYLDTYRFPKLLEENFRKNDNADIKTIDDVFVFNIDEFINDLIEHLSVKIQTKEIAHNLRAVDNEKHKYVENLHLDGYFLDQIFDILGLTNQQFLIHLVYYFNSGNYRELMCDFILDKLDEYTMKQIDLQDILFTNTNAVNINNQN